jgi:hypothetical protein
MDLITDFSRSLAEAPFPNTPCLILFVVHMYLLSTGIKQDQISVFILNKFFSYQLHPSFHPSF